MTTVGDLRDALIGSELPDDWELIPNGLGNLAICEPEYGADGEWKGRWYVGYIDIPAGKVFMRRGARRPEQAPGHPEQAPWEKRGEDDRVVSSVDRSDFGTNAP